MKTWDLMIGIYFVFTIIFFGFTAILTQREIKARTDFQMVLFGGTLNVLRYYRYLKNNHEKLSTRFKLFLLAHLNFLLCAIIILITAFSQ